MPKNFNFSFKNVSDDVAGDVLKVWRTLDIRETHTLALAVSPSDTTITLGQTSDVKAGDVLFVDDEQMTATAPAGGENGSVVPVTRAQAVAHAGGAPVSLLLYPDPFQPLGPLVRGYLQDRIRQLADSTVFHVEVAGSITESGS
jgi:hypothetical protein